MKTKALLCSGFLALLISPAPAAVLFENVQGYTLDGAGKLIRFDALLADDAGKVAAVGASAKAAAKGATVIDGKGRTLLPGLIDAHGHIMGLAHGLSSVDLSDTKSLAEACDRIRAFAAAHPDAPWILGRGWNQVVWGLNRFPTAAELDAAVPDRPVWMERVDGHAGWGNSRALALAGISAGTADPDGGRIERGAGGVPSGVFVDAAASLVTAHIPPPGKAEEAEALKGALALLNSMGLTGVGDAGIDPATWALYNEFGAQDRLTLRIYAMIDGMKAFETLGKQGPLSDLYDGRLSLRAIKLYADGALGSRGAALKNPYADDPGNRGLLFMKEAEMRSGIGRLAAAGFQVNIHAIGDAANAETIGAFESELKDRGGRHRIEHAQVMAPGDIERAARLGLIASMQPVHATSDRVMAETRLDPERLKGAYAWRSWLNAGTKLAFGSDFPVESPNPFYGLHAAVTRKDMNGAPSGGWRMEEALTLEEAFRAYTLDAAYAEFSETKTGTLEPGKWADFILIDRDIFNVAPDGLWKTRVLETWLAGKRVWCAPDECSKP